MIITTTDTIPGYKIKKVLGIVQGNVVQARWFGRDIAAGLRNIVGGEVKSYSELLINTRILAVERMKEEAKKLGADAIVNVRFATVDIMQGSAEVLAYGTAVKL